MSDLNIYDDQHGTRIYPSVENIINEKLKNFFNKKIRLYIEKTRNDELTIICNIKAYEKMGRVEGYYLKYTSIYTQDSFGSFKKETEKLLSDLEFHLKNTSPIDNIIFNNIEKFDTNKSEDINTFEDISIVLEAVHGSKNLLYKAGRIDEIIIFCKNILRYSNFVKLVISANEGKSNEAEIDIFFDEKHQEHLSPTQETEKILKYILAKKIKEEQENAIKLEEEGTKQEKYPITAKKNQPNTSNKRKFKHYQEEQESLPISIDIIIITVVIILLSLLITIVWYEDNDKINESAPIATPAPTSNSTIISVRANSSETYTNNSNGNATITATSTP